MPIEIRKPSQLTGLDGLVLPGGESTTMLKFLEKHHFFAALQEFCAAMPVFGTCAGAILLAREVLNPPQRSLSVLDAIVERNAYGRQVDSAIVTAQTKLPGGPLEMVFIRAPRITETGPGVEVLAERDGFPTLVRQAASWPPPSIPNSPQTTAFTGSSWKTSSQQNNQENNPAKTEPCGHFPPIQSNPGNRTPGGGKLL